MQQPEARTRRLMSVSVVPPFDLAPSAAVRSTTEQSSNPTLTQTAHPSPAGRRHAGRSSCAWSGWPWASRRHSIFPSGREMPDRPKGIRKAAEWRGRCHKKRTLGPLRLLMPPFARSESYRSLHKLSKPPNRPYGKLSFAPYGCVSCQTMFIKDSVGIS